jgi:hypothetical protein
MFASLTNGEVFMEKFNAGVQYVGNFSQNQWESVTIGAVLSFITAMVFGVKLKKRNRRIKKQEIGLIDNQQQANWTLEKTVTALQQAHKAELEELRNPSPVIRIYQMFGNALGLFDNWTVSTPAAEETVGTYVDPTTKHTLTLKTAKNSIKFSINNEDVTDHILGYEHNKGINGNQTLSSIFRNALQVKKNKAETDRLAKIANLLGTPAAPTHRDRYA